MLDDARVHFKESRTGKYLCASSSPPFLGDKFAATLVREEGGGQTSLLTSKSSFVCEGFLVGGFSFTLLLSYSLMRQQTRFIEYLNRTGSRVGRMMQNSNRAVCLFRINFIASRRDFFVVCIGGQKGLLFYLFLKRLTLLSKKENVYDDFDDFNVPYSHCLFTNDCRLINNCTMIKHKRKLFPSM